MLCDGKWWRWQSHLCSGIIALPPPTSATPYTAAGHKPTFEWSSVFADSEARGYDEHWLLLAELTAGIEGLILAKHIGVINSGSACPIPQRSSRAWCISTTILPRDWGCCLNCFQFANSSNKFCLEADRAVGRGEQIRTNCLQPLNFASPPSPSTQPIIQADAKCKLIISWHTVNESWLSRDPSKARMGRSSDPAVPD